MNRPRSFLAVVFVLWLTEAAVVRAGLQCDEPQVTLSDVKAGQPVSHRFTIINRSADVIEITNLQPSCGCLKPQMAEKRLRPGETGVLVLGVNTLTSPSGPNTWRVQVFYKSGGQMHDLTLELHATVITEIEVQPAALVLHTGTSIGHEITLTDGRSKPLTVTSVRTTSPRLQAACQEVRRDEKGRRVQGIRLDVLPGFPDGKHEETVQIFTSDPEYPELRIPVTVVKLSRAAVSAVPTEVSLTAFAGQPLPARVILLRNAEGREVEVNRVECDNPAVHCTQAKGPGSMTTIRVQIDRERVPADGLHTALHVQLTKPSTEVMTIPVNCVLK